MHISSAGAKFDARKIIGIAIVIVPCLLMVLLAIPSNPPQQQARAATGELLVCSTASDGSVSNGNSSRAFINHDGRYVSFTSAASNLVIDDTNGCSDIFLKDTTSGVTVRCSTDSADSQANRSSGNSSVDSLGQRVAFLSTATNLVVGGTNGVADVFCKDLTTGVTIRCSNDSYGNEADGDSANPVISGNGRYVVFESNASNLVTGDNNAKKDVFRKDLATGEIIRCSQSATSVEGNDVSEYPCVSTDGRYVSFSTAASNLIPSDTNASKDVIRLDCDTGALLCCSMNSGGVQGNGNSSGPSISADGGKVLFSSIASNLVSNDTNNEGDIFRKDLATGHVLLCSTDQGGVQRRTNLPRMSGDGRYVIFCSLESFVPRSSSYQTVYRKDLETGEILNCNCNDSGEPGGGHAYSPAISGDGSYVAFDTYGYNDNDDVFRKKPLYETAFISSISPTRGRVGSEVTIEGQGFGLTRGDSYVSFDSTNATEYILWSDNRIVVKAPYNLEAGKHFPSVTTFKGKSNHINNSFFVEPYISSVSDNSGHVGSIITITGMSFGNAQDRSYLKIDSSYYHEFISWSNTEIKFKVPRIAPNGEDMDLNLYIDLNDGTYFECPCGKFQVIPFEYCFAEGYTGAGFQEYLCLGNVNNYTVDVTIYYLLPDNYYWDQKITVPANSRTTVNVNAEVPDMEVSAYIVSDLDVVVERPMYFNYNGCWTGGHDAVASRYMSKNWFFAEGYTGPGFDEWVCVLNLGDVDTNLTFHFQTQEEGEVVRTAVVPKASRGSFKVNDLLGPNYQCSLWLESDQFVIAERSMYFDYMGASAGHWEGGHCVMGVTHLSKEYYFAEGTTRAGFEEWLTIQNPDDHDISVSATYQMQAGQGDPVVKTYKIGPGQRATAFVPSEVGMEKDVSIKLTSDSYFLAERPMYFRYMDAWEGGHCVIGAMQPSSDWFFAEGYTGDGFHEWLCLQNPGTKESTVEVTYLVQGSGPLEPRTVKVGAGSRVTIAVNLDAGTGLSLSTQLRVTSGPAIVAERPMYFDFNGWDGGHDVVGYTPELASSLSYQSADSSGAALILPGIDGLPWKKK